MSTKIFYYSGTGNSLYFARRIAAGLGETELIPIPKALADHVAADTPKVGLVFPVLAWGLPRLVADFVKGLKLNDGQYVFAIATCGGTQGKTLLDLESLLQNCGGKLDASFAVKEGPGGSAKDASIIKLVRSVNWKKARPGEERFQEILAVIKNNRKHRPETSSFASNFLGGSFHSTAINSFKTADRNYVVDEKCRQCGTCERVCPRKNITIENKPVWHQNCEQCSACYRWCPNQAIHRKGAEDIYYHHPEVKLKDMLLW